MKKILVAKIISAFGIKGEVNLLSYCKNAKDLEKFPLFYEENNAIKLKIKSKNKKDKLGNFILTAKIKNVNNRNQSEALRGKEVFTNRKNFDELKNKNEFYQIDLIGLDVVEKDGKKLGKVLNILNFGGGISLEIEFEKENKTLNLTKIESFPFKKEFFGEVNVKKGFIEIILP